MGNEKPSSAMKIPETGKWSTEAQNKVMKFARDDMQRFASEVIKDSDPTKTKWNVRDGDTLGAIAFAFDKAYKNLGRDLKINWGTTVEFTRDGATKTVKLAQVNPKDFTIYKGDAIQLKIVDGKTVITVNGGAAPAVPAAASPEAGKYGPDVKKIDVTGPDVKKIDVTGPDVGAGDLKFQSGYKFGGDVLKKTVTGGDVSKKTVTGPDVKKE